MTDETAHPEHSKRVFLGMALVVFAPLAVFALLATPNEYQAMGIEGAVDCDGPLVVLLFAVPSLVVYTAGLISFAWPGPSSRSARSIVSAIICSIICIALTVNLASALKEHSSEAHQESCGPGL